MKRIIRILVLAVFLVAGLASASAQTVQVVITPKVASLPTTVTSYLDDPFRYFNVQFVAMGAGEAGIDVYIDFSLTVNTSPSYIRTRPGSVPHLPIHLQEGINIMDSDLLQFQFLHRTETNVDYTNPLNLQQLPEGTYNLCVDVYLWNGNRYTMQQDPISIDPTCATFELCYSGSAPELVSPVAGAQMSSNGALVVTPNKKLNFFWTPVIANCAGRTTRFKYKLKVVKVLNGQNYQDAIRINPTVFSAEVNNSTHAVLDVMRDIKVQMEDGALYVAQVQAEPIPTGRSGGEEFIIANDGNSQPMPFFWNVQGENNAWMRGYNVSVDEEESEEGDEDEGVDGLTYWEGGVEEESELQTIIDDMKEQYLASFIQDASTVASLTTYYPDERPFVPTPKRRYVKSDGYYTVPMTDDLEVSFMPSRHEALKDVSYTIELYENIDGDVDSTTAVQPLHMEEINDVPDSYSKMDSHELLSRELPGWGADLEQGNLYYLQLSCNFKVSYWNYSIADTTYYVNEMVAEHIHDTLSREFVEDELTYSNGVFFQWGDDPEAPAVMAPQWKAPFNRSDDDILDPANYALPASVPELQKSNAFSVSWTPVRGVEQGDTVNYEVNVYEVKSGQTLEEAIEANPVVVTRTVSNATAINARDIDFFKVFSPNKTYVMTLSADIESEENGYHFENGSEAIPVVFKMVK